MRLHRFFVPFKIGDQDRITVDSIGLIDQVHKVFRFGIGNSIIVFDGSGNDYECLIEVLDKKSVILSISDITNSRFMPQKNIILCAALVKKDKFEWIVEKATELGVTHIVPIQAEYSEKKGLNLGRLNKIAIEASEQSGRGNVPLIHSIHSLNDIFDSSNSTYQLISDSRCLIFHTEGIDMTHANPKGSDSVKPDHIKESISIFIGPEGGWSEKEIKMFHDKNIDTYCLGRQVLRAETAVISALSLQCLNIS